MAEDEEAARAAFAEWASLLTGAPSRVAELVQQIDVKHEHIGLLASDIQGRRVVWKFVPASGRSRVTVPSTTLEAIDAWTTDSASLRTSSDHVAICDACGGEKKVRCASCRGTGKLVCGVCRGQRKIDGYAANGSRRLLNCTNCRGKGDVDCADCRRGIARCSTCDGEGRLQRWIELEWWRRSVASVHPDSLTRRFAWDEDVSDDCIERDAEVVFRVERPHRLTPSDLGSVPAQWLSILNPALRPGERIERQRLRIARAPVYELHYRLGSNNDRVVFAGRRLFSPPPNTPTLLARRASNLRSLARLLIIVGIGVAIFSLGRGLFFASIATFFSLVAASAMLFAIYNAASDWTAARRHTSRWLAAAGACLLLAIAEAVAALPHLAHARSLIATEDLDHAQLELQALGEDAPPHVWADLRLARIRGSTDIDNSRELLAKIPRRLPQYETAAPLVHLPLVQREIERSNWNAAAGAVLDARRAGIAASLLAPRVDAMLRAANAAIADANHESDVQRRLRMRLSAENTFVAWERASGHWGTPSLIALRTAMAHDIAALEKPDRRPLR